MVSVLIIAQGKEKGNGKHKDQHDKRMNVYSHSNPKLRIFKFSSVLR